MLIAKQNLSHFLKESKKKNTEGHFGVLQVKRMYDEDIQIFTCSPRDNRSWVETS